MQDSHSALRAVLQDWERSEHPIRDDRLFLTALQEPGRCYVRYTSGSPGDAVRALINAGWRTERQTIRDEIFQTILKQPGDWVDYEQIGAMLIRHRIMPTKECLEAIRDENEELYDRLIGTMTGRQKQSCDLQSTA